MEVSGGKWVAIEHLFESKFYLEAFPDTVIQGHTLLLIENNFKLSNKPLHDVPNGRNEAKLQIAVFEWKNDCMFFKKIKQPGLIELKLELALYGAPTAPPSSAPNP